MQVIDGKDLLNERTNAELKYLKKVNLVYNLLPLFDTSKVYRCFCSDLFNVFVTWLLRASPAVV